MSDKIGDGNQEKPQVLAAPDQAEAPQKKGSLPYTNYLIDDLAANRSYPPDDSPRYNLRLRMMSDEAIQHARKLIQQVSANSAVQPDHPHIVLAPGYRLVKVLKFFCRKTTAQSLIDPMHAELFAEYCELLKDKRHWKAAYTKCLIPAFLVYAVLSERVLAVLGSLLAGRFKSRSDK